MLLISIEDANGVRLGAGPITSADGWRHHGEVNRAGSFSFRMPAADAKASLVRAFRWARAWTADVTGLREVGRGRIMQRKRVLGPDGAPMLEVSGPDQMDELADRLLLRAALHDERLRHPVEVSYGDHAYVSLALDFLPGDTSTWAENTHAQPIFVRHSARFSEVHFTIHAPQTGNNPGHINYSTSGGWRVLTVDETTHADGDVWFDHSGYVRFEPPDDWAPLDGEHLYQLVFGVDSSWSVFSVADVAIGGVLAPTNEAVSQVLAYTPGWELDTANGYARTQPRPLSGVELMTNVSFDAHTGTADDATTDSWTDWQVLYANDAQGHSALASTTAHTSGKAVKLTHGVGATYVDFRQAVNVLPATEYTLTFWTRGDGVGQLAFTLYDLGNSQRITEIVDCGVTGTAWTEVRRTFTTLAVTSVLGVIFFAPIADNAAAWVDDVSLQSGGNGAVFLQLAEESALEGLIRITELTGEKFTAGLLDRLLLWLGRDARPSGLRAVGWADPLMVRAASEILLIVDAEELEDAEDLVSRVYVYGAGSGTARLRPTDATLEPPDGYVLNRDLGYVERTAAVAAMGVIECSQQWDDIVPAVNGQATDEARVQAANQLVMAGVSYLEQHSCTDTDPDTGDVPKFFHLTLAKTSRQIVPGYTLTVRYEHWRDGVRSFGITGELWITGVDREVAPDGSQTTVGVDVATVPRPPMSLTEMQVRELRRMRSTRGHTIAVGC